MSMQFTDLPTGRQAIVGTAFDKNLYGIDYISGLLSTIDHVSYAVHLGCAYIMSDVQSVSTTTQKWLIITPNTTEWAHMNFSIECTGEMYVVVTEGADRTTGTELTPINHNRNITATAEVRVLRGATGGTTDGATTIFAERVGSTTSGPFGGGGLGKGGNAREFLLRQNTRYVVSVTTYAAVYVSLELDWFEHTNSYDRILPSVSPSASPSLSPSISPSLSASLSPSLSSSVSPSASLSPSLSPSLSASLSSSVSPSASLSPSLSPSLSASLSPSLSPSLSASISPSASPSEG